MDSSAVLSLLESLDCEIDDLEESLEPVLVNALSDTASKLPLLDKAKLYVLMTYAIESLLFSYLRLNGVKAREHPVFGELSRVKQYFDKITAAETPLTQREKNMSVDKQATSRFIKAALSGNDKYDLERSQRLTKELRQAHIKFDQQEQNPKIASATSSAPSAVAETSDDSSSSSESEVKLVVKEAPREAVKSKKRKGGPSASLEDSEKTPSSKKKKKHNGEKERSKKKSKKVKDQ